MALLCSSPKCYFDYSLLFTLCDGATKLKYIATNRIPNEIRLIFELISIGGPCADGLFHTIKIVIWMEELQMY